jgi:hypothetical protein
MLQHKSLMIVTLATIGLATSSHAQLDYTYAEIEYENINFEGGDSDSDGDAIGLEGSFHFGKRYFVYGDYRSYDLDDSFDLDLAEVGFGFHTTGSEKIHFVTSIGYIAADFNRPGSDRENGVHLQVGVRGMVVPRLSLEGFVGYRNIGEFKGTFSGAVRYHFSERISADLEALVGADVTTYGVGFRYSFGN